MEANSKRLSSLFHFLMATSIMLTIFSSVAAFPAGNSTSNSTLNETEALFEVITQTLSPTDPPPVEFVPDIVITLAVIAVCAGVGIGIAKFADFIYDRYTAKFSTKERNENTRNLLRARVAVMRMKADPKAPDLKSAKKAASTWMSKAAGKKKADPQNPTLTNQIGSTHVPGIQIGQFSKKDGNSDTKEHTKISELPGKEKGTSSGMFPSIQTEPIELTTNRIKSDTRLPPVVVNDTQK
ncbi:uncharacterized protein [Watersipora subatra]|uniref:uncharacterized protein n=1 Tax=Watersipora subatra TaxID=2589382 RepID=UPI00355BA6E9